MLKRALTSSRASIRTLLYAKQGAYGLIKACDRHAYIPPSAERAIAQQMQRNMPAHLKKYVGPYVQQHVVNQSMVQPGTVTQPSPGLGPQPTPHAPIAPLPQQDFTHIGISNPERPPTPAATKPIMELPEADAEPAPPSTYPTGYEFMAEPKKSSRQLWKIPTAGTSGAKSLPKRLAILSGGLLVLVILFIVVKNLIGGGPGFAPFVAVAQDQQEIVHLTGSATTGTQSQALSMADQNFAATTSLSVASAQAGLITYLSNNSYKIATKQLSLKVSTSLDTQLTNAQAAGTYDQTFQQIMQTQLNNYSSDLQLAYKSAGPKGKTLLNGDYQQLKLLVQQLGSAGTS
jgi:hypothetical protein